jgi:splicing factor, arginine/serine-rich 2
VRYKYEDEAQKAVDRLDGTFYLTGSHKFICSARFEILCVAGRVVDGREIMVQFAKYGPNAERM